MSDARRDSVVIERMVDAPVERVWLMWTDPQHFAAWYGPDGATIHVAKMDLSVGGARLVRMDMDTPGGPRRMWFSGEHLEIMENQRLAYSESMADEHGHVLTPSELGLPADHPVTTQVVVDLEDLGGRTKVVLTHIGVPPGSPGAAGWNMALDKLAIALADPAS
jgi:uncharacterized protein YndB with AHSA1/START domain